MHLARSARLPWATLLALASLWTLVLPTAALAWGAAPQPLPGIPNNVRRPRIAGQGNYFHVIFQQNNNRTLFYLRGLASANGQVAWEFPVTLAANVVGEKNWDIVADDNGTVHVVYASSTRQLVYLTNSQNGAGIWNPPETIAGLPNQANGVDITLDAAQVPYVAWGQGVDPSNLYVAYREGSWVVKNADNDTYLVRNPQLVVAGSGPSATIHAMYEVAFGNGKPFFVGYTRGRRDSALGNANFSLSFDEPGYAERPTLALDRSSGLLYTGHVAGSINQGYFLQFTYSVNNGESWAPLTPRALNDDNTLWADESPMHAGNGTAYIMLPAKQFDGRQGFTSVGYYDLRFTFATRQFSTPVPIRSNNDPKNVSPDYALNAVAKAGVWVTGYTEGIAYNSEAGGLLLTPSAEVVINNAAAFTSNPSVTVELRNVIGTPTQMRVALDGDPTAAPLEPFQASFTRLFPAASTCVRSVAVQLVNSSGSSPTLADTITVDTSVQANVLARNPFKRGNLKAAATAPGVRVPDDGDSDYTALTSFYAEVDARAECTSLTQLRIGADAANLGELIATSGNLYAEVLPIPGTPVVGANNVTFQVGDAAGNTTLISKTIIYDPTPPVLETAGTLSITVPLSGTNIFAQLDFSGSVVSDTLYPGRHFWGVWLANSRTLSADPLNDPALDWFAVEAPGDSADFTIANWNLLNGLTREEQTAGDYIVYARFLDGAGNATTGVLTSTVRLETLVKPTVSLPIIRK